MKVQKEIQNIADEDIIKIPVKECGEELINLKKYNAIAYGPPPDTPLTADDYTKVRKTIYRKLCSAQNNLPNGWKFRLYEGLRSLHVQELLFKQQIESLKTQRSYDNHEHLFKEACRLISPITNLDGTPNIPPHSTGSAIDIELIDAHGNLVNMGMTIKDWLIVDPGLCETNSKLISNEAKHNRAILLEIMEDHGFVNYPREWWHFSYGDRLWAYLTENTYALYGSIVK